ncbi:transglutaminase family protein [Oculatella sp. LEGE 06141]|uniref:transglutaminase family protein n=1 Tax=Oculatella sp. LEGE 06141 TaxID=1828648 RepID=UPI001881DDD4|nr:transglutaminase family protein [Oculatella sp. LEGE 06141]MBE9179010.1 transglutaminase family protein [Oculatella sp. LEGE 06141]
MRYQIIHTTTYTYDRPVMLSAHTVRLRPRCDVTQMLQQFSLNVNPEPSRISETVDLDGNGIIKLWFPDETTDLLSVKAAFEVETYRSNPFDFLLEAWATNLPIDYPVSLFCQLQPYLAGHLGVGGVDAIAVQLAQEVWQATHGNTIAFLSELNQRIYTTCDYTVRETGAPLPPGITWTQKLGSCRDVAVLFMEACRAMGLAARFVSGYQEGDPDSDNRDLHAWAEVYLPGAGWRGYDPTHGLAVSDRHIALVTSPFPQSTTPISGSLKMGAGVQSEMHYQLSIQPLDPA